MAYFSERLVQRLCLHYPGRQQKRQGKTDLEYVHCLVLDGILAWGFLEFCVMGAVLLCHPVSREAGTAKGNGMLAGFFTACLYEIYHCDRLDALCK